MNYLAIDPGAGGGIAWKMDDDVGCQNMPKSDVECAAFIRTMLAKGGVDRTKFIIEKVPKVTGARTSPSAMSVLHDNSGTCKGAAYALLAMVIPIDPRSWQQFFHLGTRKLAGSDTKWKNKLKAEAMRRFPNHKITLATADAMLILEWARLTNQ